MVADAVRFYSLRTDLMDAGAMIAPPCRLMREDLPPARGVNGETDYEWRLFPKTERSDPSGEGPHWGMKSSSCRQG